MRWFILICIVALLTGCADQSGTMQQLKLENQALSSDLDDAKNKIEWLNVQNEDLNRKITELQDITVRLQTEKDVRVAESGTLRASIREFIKRQSSELRKFSSKEDLLDYFGSELIERSFKEGENLSLVDTRNVITGTGTIVSVKGLFDAPANFKLVVLREVQGNWLVIWETKFMENNIPGTQVVDLDVPVSVEKGDIVGYVFKGPVGVSFDTGTGGTHVFEENLSTGSKIPKTGFADYKSRRAFSIGVQVILN